MSDLGKVYCCACYFFNYLGEYQQRITVVSCTDDRRRSSSICKRLCTLRLSSIKPRVARLTASQVAGLREDLKLKGNEYSILLSMFTAGYVYLSSHWGDLTSFSCYRCSTSGPASSTCLTDSQMQLCRRADSSRPHNPKDQSKHMVTHDADPLVRSDHVLGGLQYIRAALCCAILSGLHGG
jgi:hypothetical protein